MVAKHKKDYSLGEALKGFISENRLEKGIEQVRVKELWHQLMGQGVSTYTTAVSLKENTLYISLSSSVLRQELSLGKGKIITMLNSELGEERITKLVLR